MASRSVSDRESFWRALISRREALQLTVAQTCEQAGVSTASFFQWQRKLRMTKPRTARGQKTELQKAQQASLLPVRIVEDRREDPCREITVELPSGVRVCVPTGCDERTLACVLQLAFATTKMSTSRGEACF